MRRARTPRLAAAVVVLGLPLLGACNGDSATRTSSTDPIEVEVGKQFTFNGFTVADDWTVSAIEREAGVDTINSPTINGEVTNDGDRPGYALFAVTFSGEGKALATVNCASKQLKPGATGDLDCPGFGQIMPEKYDRVVVAKIQRSEG